MRLLVRAREVQPEAAPEAQPERAQGSLVRCQPAPGADAAMSAISADSRPEHAAPGWGCPTRRGKTAEPAPDERPDVTGVALEAERSRAVPEPRPAGGMTAEPDERPDAKEVASEAERSPAASEPRPMAASRLPKILRRSSASLPASAERPAFGRSVHLAEFRRDRSSE
jgi:hypothetical protein